jgi:TATA-binding protein-associated factor Taf7
MSNNTPKLAEVFNGRGSDTFTPAGFIDKHGRFVPLVRVKAARHALSISTIADIEREYDAMIKAAIESLSPEHEAKMRAEIAKQSAESAEPAESAEHAKPAKRAAPLADRIASSTVK